MEERSRTYNEQIYAKTKRSENKNRNIFGQLNVFDEFLMKYDNEMEKQTKSLSSSQVLELIRMCSCVYRIPVIIYLFAEMK